MKFKVAYAQDGFILRLLCSTASTLGSRCQMCQPWFSAPSSSCRYSRRCMHLEIPAPQRKRRLGIRNKDSQACGRHVNGLSGACEQQASICIYTCYVFVCLCMFLEKKDSRTSTSNPRSSITSVPKLSYGGLSISWFLPEPPYTSMYVNMPTLGPNVCK